MTSNTPGFHYFKMESRALYTVEEVLHFLERHEDLNDDFGLSDDSSGDEDVLVAPGDLDASYPEEFFAGGGHVFSDEEEEEAHCIVARPSCFQGKLR